MEIYLTKWFARWANKEGVTDQHLVDAILEIERGLIDAQLGGHVFKKRVATGGRGKSSGFRVLIAIKLQNRAFFLYGFSKNQRANIDSKDLHALKKMAAHLFAYGDREIARALENDELIRVDYEKK